jgi:hypothetical protein
VGYAARVARGDDDEICLKRSFWEKSDKPTRANREDRNTGADEDLRSMKCPEPVPDCQPEPFIKQMENQGLRCIVVHFGKGAFSAITEARIQTPWRLMLCAPKSRYILRLWNEPVNSKFSGEIPYAQHRQYVKTCFQQENPQTLL